MRKLKLSIEELSVESFSPLDAVVRKGTVLAHETEFEFCGGAPSDGLVHTCLLWQTCQGVNTCNFAKTCDIRQTRCCGPTVDFMCG